MNLITSMYPNTHNVVRKWIIRPWSDPEEKRLYSAIATA